MKSDLASSCLRPGGLPGPAALRGGGEATEVTCGLQDSSRPASRPPEDSGHDPPTARDSKSSGSPARAAGSWAHRCGHGFRPAGLGWSVLCPQMTNGSLGLNSRDPRQDTPEGTPSSRPGGGCVLARGWRGSPPLGAGDGRQMALTLPPVGKPDTAESPARGVGGRTTHSPPGEAPSPDPGADTLPMNRLRAIIFHRRPGQGDLHKVQWGGLPAVHHWDFR